MISTQFIVLGSGTRGIVQLIGYFSSRGLDYTSLPLRAWTDVGFCEEGKSRVVFLCADKKCERETITTLCRLVNLGLPCILIQDDPSEGFQCEAIGLGAIDVIATPLQQTVVEDVIDIALYRQEIGRHQLSMKEHARQLSLLSPRERRIVCLAARGMPNKQIARAIGRSVKSVERLRRQAYGKLQVTSTADMTRVVLLGSLFECRTPQSFSEGSMAPTELII